MYRSHISSVFCEASPQKSQLHLILMAHDPPSPHQQKSPINKNVYISRFGISSQNKLQKNQNFPKWVKETQNIP